MLKRVSLPAFVVLRLAIRANIEHCYSGILELKIDIGPGYRIYCSQIGKQIVLLPWGGDKSTQQNVIAAAVRIAPTWKK